MISPIEERAAAQAIFAQIRCLEVPREFNKGMKNRFSEKSGIEVPNPMPRLLAQELSGAAGGDGGPVQLISLPPRMPSLYIGVIIDGSW